MRVQNEKTIVRVFAFVTIVVLFALRSFDGSVLIRGDATFLYNRCFQMWDCLKHGLYPFLYYADAGGLGYASPIFYGQLTLVPFVPFLGSASVFIKVYVLCSLLVNFFGFRFFAGRYTENATLSACLFVLSYPFLYLYNSASLYAFVLGLGFSWLFLGYCVDYFRDGKHFALLLLTYFLIWQSNLNIAFLALLPCFGLFCVYFKRARLMGYVKLFCCSVLMLLYNFVNMFVHRDAVSLVDLGVIFPPEVLESQGMFSSVWPVGGFVIRRICYGLGVLPDFRVGLFQVSLFVLLISALVTGFRKETKRFKCCCFALGVATLIGYVAGLFPFWERLWSVVSFIQSPLRYLVILSGLVCLAIGRLIKPGKIVYLCLGVMLIDCLVGCVVQTGGFEEWASPLYMQIGNAEYAGKEFVRDWAWQEENSLVVTSKSGTAYDFIDEYNGLSIDCSSNPGVDVLTLPKLYYKGYSCVKADGSELSVRSGYSNYCEVDIGSYTGVLRLEYKCPFYLVLLLVWQYLFVLWLVKEVYYERAKRK